MNLEAFEEWVTNEGEGWDEFSWTFRKPLVTQFGTIEVLEEHGGEGQGDQAWVVFSVDGETYRKSGYYASYYGFEWDGPLESVRPVERVITVWES